MKQDSGPGPKKNPEIADETEEQNRQTSRGNQESPQQTTPIMPLANNPDYALLLGMSIWEWLSKLPPEGKTTFIVPPSKVRLRKRRLNVDAFKDLNSRGSTSRGDLSIRMLAKILQEELEESDGDAVTKLENARERVANIVVRYEFPDGSFIEGKGINLNYAQGEGGDLNSKLASADQALKAKKAARKTAGLLMGAWDIHIGVAVESPTIRDDDIKSAIQGTREHIQEPEES